VKTNLLSASWPLPPRTLHAEAPTTAAGAEFTGFIQELWWVLSETATRMAPMDNREPLAHLLVVDDEPNIASCSP
jgi:hypothetical protein